MEVSRSPGSHEKVLSAYKIVRVRDKISDSCWVVESLL